MKRTHCRAGHKLTRENVDERGSCRVCERIAARRRLAARKAALLERIAAGEAVSCDNGHRMTARTVGYGGGCLLCRAESRPAPRVPRHRPYVTHCRNGHPRTPEDTDSKGRCMVCARKTAKANYRAMMDDPSRHVAWKEYNRFRQEKYRRERGAATRNWSPETLVKRNGGWASRHAERVVDPAPFLSWLDDWFKHHPTTTREQLCRRAGSAPRTIFTMRAGDSERIHLSVVDRFLLAAGESPHVLSELYPLGDHAFPVAA